MASSNGDALHADKLRPRSNLALNFQTKRNGLADARHEFVQRPRLCATTRKFRHTGYVITFFVALDDHVEFTLGGFSQGPTMPRRFLVRKL